ncbi:MAG: phosphonate metabolism transcriptional regulator PhnF [Rhizobiales bacterium]|nr:phosphonate metabolism transcriptional regulator PhnF [Hyphomicrobiales bacterium]
MRKAAGARVHRGVGVALWRPVAGGIRSAIAAGIADGQGRLPSEVDLASRFGVNRHTVRAAIQALAQEGVLAAEQGRGTYVRRQRKLVYPIGARTRFSAGFDGQARTTSVELLDHGEEAAPGVVAEALGFAPGSRLPRVETLGKADGVAVSRATHWFAGGRFRKVAATIGRTGSITRALAAVGIRDYVRASTLVEASHADVGDTQVLGLSPGAIVLVTRALNHDPAGAPIQYSVSRFPADRVELII